MDISILDTLNKALAGDKKALLDMSVHYLDGKKTPKNPIEAKELLLKLVDTEDKDISEFEYGGLYAAVGDLFYEEENYHFAHNYYQKAKDFLFDTYSDDYAEKIMEELNLEYSLSITTEQ